MGDVTMLARQIAIGFGIAVILPLLIYYGVSTFHPAPKIQDFYKNTEILGPNTTPEERKEFQEKRRKDVEAFSAANKEFSRVLVMAATPLGIAAILIGSYLAINSIGTGLILGGIIAVAFGYWGYWQYLEDWIRFASLLFGFLILLFVGYRIFKVTQSHASTS
jgi:hypothetical protein